MYVGTVAYNNDFQVGDRIIAVNSIEVHTCSQVRDVINACHAGDAVNVTVLRNDEPLDISVTLTENDVDSSATEFAA